MPDETTVTVGQFSEALRAFAPEFCIIGNMTAGQLLDALAAAERELEGVKRVEAWLMQQPLTHYITRNYDGHYEATAAGRVVPNTEAQSPTLAALGHALPDDTAQEGE